MESCHKDDIKINYWQPLPPSIYDVNGERLYGYEECGMLGTDMQSCHNPDCTHFEVRQVRLTWSSTYYVFSSRNGRRKIILMPAWASKICIRRTETITSGASTNLE